MQVSLTAKNQEDEALQRLDEGRATTFKQAMQRIVREERRPSPYYMSFGKKKHRRGSPSRGA